MPPLPQNGKGDLLQRKVRGKDRTFFAFAGAGEIVLGRKICYTILN